MLANLMASPGHAVETMPPPEWVMYLFTGINVGIALSYGLLAFFFASRIKLPKSVDRNPLTILACAGAMLFFIGCAHTHVDLAFWSATDNLKAHWYSWFNVLSHGLQGLGGLTFWVLATFYLQVNIFDKRHYERTIGSTSVDEPVEK